MIGFLVWTVLIWFLASYVFIGWDALFWIATWMLPPLILWPIVQTITA